MSTSPPQARPGRTLAADGTAATESAERPIRVRYGDRVDEVEATAITVDV